MMDHKDKKPFYYKRWFIVLIVISIISVLAAIGSNHNAEQSVSGGGQISPAASGNPTQKPLPSMALTESPAESPSASPISVRKQLISGHYTAGIDFPEGIYDITAVSGKGNVYSSNMYSGGINAAMGVKDPNAKSGSDIYAQQASKVALKGGVVLSVSGGVVIQISSHDASGNPLIARAKTNTGTVQLGSGKFVAGRDFPAGTYNVVAISGSGNVYSDNMYNGGINASMGTEEANAAAGWDLYERCYNNIEFRAGVALTVSGVELQLVPSK
ncbi:MAG: hypothetical protein PHT34_07220 [Oscillospiraceae bacterium]|nr:hypothetical protein [Oscillospiraceae bacterium]